MKKRPKRKVTLEMPADQIIEEVSDEEELSPSRCKEQSGKSSGGASPPKVKRDSSLKGIVDWFAQSNTREKPSKPIKDREETTRDLINSEFNVQQLSPGHSENQFELSAKNHPSFTHAHKPSIDIDENMNKQEQSASPASHLGKAEIE